MAEDEFSYDALLKKALSEVPEVREESERFQLPEIQSRIEGSRTRICHVDGLSVTFHRELSHLTKYLLKELGTVGQVDGGDFVVQGKFRNQIVEQKIKAYYRKYVECYDCNKPDSVLKKEKGVFMVCCEACGARRSVSRL